MTRVPRLAANLLLAVALALPAGTAGAADTAAVAVNDRDGSEVFRLAFSVQRILSPVVDESNVAVAVASCEDCQTVAISLQAVLVFSDPEVVTPENLALAMNVECSSCDTLAGAYQWVLGTGGIVRLTDEGQRRLAEIRRSLYELRRQGLSVTEIQARVDMLADELEQVLAEELVAVQPLVAGGETPGPSASPSASASASPTQEASGAEGAEPSASPPPEQSATPSEQPSATPTASETGA